MSEQDVRKKADYEGNLEANLKASMRSRDQQAVYLVMKISCFEGKFKRISWN
jgi:hypothetical protein